MNRLTRLTVVFGAMMLADLMMSTTAQAQTFTQSIPLDFGGINSCVPETVFIQGELQITIQQNFDATGSHFDQHFVSKGVGVGVLTGARYNFSEETNNSLQIPGPPQTVAQEVVINHVLIAGGSVPNFYLKVRIHLTLNASGVPTANIVDATTYCH